MTIMRAGVLSSLALLAACSTDVAPFTSSELTSIANKRSADLIAVDQVPVTGPVGLHEAMARAIKYNLDHKVDLANVSLAETSKNLVAMDMLPDLVASSEFSSRSNDPGGRSVTLSTGVVSTNSSRSADRKSDEQNLTLSWDILDFGLSYYRAKQSGNDILIAAEQRRATVNRLVENVRTTYWRAVSHDRLAGRIATLETKANRALRQSRNMQNGGFSSPKEGLLYQRDLLRVIGELKALQRDLSLSKHQLAALINIQPGQEFKVRVPRRATLPEVTKSPEEMVKLAYVNRPELRELSYEQRNIDLSKKSAVLELLPSIRPYLTQTYSSNDLLENRDWVTSGTRASWDLMKLLTYPRRKAQLASNAALLEAQALALSHAVATQVYVADARYRTLRQETRLAAQMADVSRKIARTVTGEAASGLIGAQEEVLEEMSAILAELRFDARYAEMEGAYASLFSAVGLNNYPADFTGNEPLDQLEDAIHDM